MGLSAKALAYLAKLERTSSTVGRQEIIDSFIANDAPVFEPLIEFQQNYSGYKLIAGLVPIQFGLLQGDGGYPIRTGTAIIEFDFAETGNSEYLFVCAKSDIGINLQLDEYGRFYQDYKILASSFEKAIEQWTILDEIANTDTLKILFQNQQLNVEELDKKLSLTLIKEASDAYTLWFKNDSTYMIQNSGLTTIFTSEIFHKIRAAINL